MVDSDALYRRCVGLGADAAAVAAWPDHKRLAFIQDRAPTADELFEDVAEGLRAHAACPAADSMSIN
jgi:hypothetical protein